MIRWTKAATYVTITNIIGSLSLLGGLTVKMQQVVAIYCRLSKEDLDKSNRGDDSESIQNQKLLLVDHATKNDFLIYKVYVDEDLSGFSDRPSFKQMIKDAADGQFNIILCKHQ